MIRFSIIIPNKNIPELLQRCLDSIPLREDMEVIVVDDNSSPDVVDFDDFPGNDRRNVKVVYTKEGKGAGYARNVGLQHAKGEWVLFADADDYFTFGINKILDNCDSQYDVIYFNALSLDNETYKLAPRCNHLNRMCEIWEENKEEGEKYLRYYFGEPWCKIIKMALIRKYGLCFEEVPIHNDTFFSYSLGLAATNLNVDSRCGYVVSQRTDSLYTTFSEEKMLTRMNVFARKYTTLKEYELEVFEFFIPFTLNQLKNEGNDELYNKCVKVINSYGLDENNLPTVTDAPGKDDRYWMYENAYDYILYIGFIHNVGSIYTLYTKSLKLFVLLRKVARALLLLK